MNKNIDTLLKKYFDAETSIEEERVLQNYFQQHKNEIKKEHHTYIAMFSYFQESKNEIAKMESPLEPPTNKKPKLSIWHFASLIAACIAILVVTFGINNQKEAIEHSVVYIDGVKIDNDKVLYFEALKSLQDVEESNNDIINSQIEILDSFIDL